MSYISPVGVSNLSDSLTGDTIQKYLEENKQLILAILENRNLGKLKECKLYQTRLQQNLCFLATLADSQKTAESAHNPQTQRYLGPNNPINASTQNPRNSSQMPFSNQVSSTTTNPATTTATTTTSTSTPSSRGNFYGFDSSSLVRLRMQEAQAMSSQKPQNFSIPPNSSQSQSQSSIPTSYQLKMMPKLNPQAQMRITEQQKIQHLEKLKQEAQKLQRMQETQYQQYQLRQSSLQQQQQQQQQQQTPSLQPQQHQSSTQQQQQHAPNIPQYQQTKQTSTKQSLQSTSSQPILNSRGAFPYNQITSNPAQMANFIKYQKQQQQQQQQKHQQQQQKQQQQKRQVPRSVNPQQFLSGIQTQSSQKMSQFSPLTEIGTTILKSEKNEEQKKRKGSDSFWKQLSPFSAKDEKDPIPQQPVKKQKKEASPLVTEDDQKEKNLSPPSLEPPLQNQKLLSPSSAGGLDSLPLLNFDTQSNIEPFEPFDPSKNSDNSLDFFLN